jgi:hypothetical protein
MALLSPSLLALAENDLAANRSVEVDDGDDGGKSWRRPDPPTALAFLMEASRIMVIVSYSLSLGLLAGAFRSCCRPPPPPTNNNNNQHQR